MSLENYLAVSGIDPAQLTPEFHAQLAQFQQQILQLPSEPGPTLRWSYDVPELGEGGTCSLFGQLAAQPYDLAHSLGGITWANEHLLAQSTLLVAFYRQHSRSDWFGIYQKRRKADQADMLIKLAYYGVASRAEFPLTDQFSAMSNNSTVGLSGQGRIINQVSRYLSAGGEYYTCDPKVQAEACLPVLDAQGKVLGIVDSETFAEHTFVGQELALLVAVVMRLSDVL